MKDKYNIGMLGTGAIAKVLSKNIEACDGRIVKYACASRNVDNAHKFAANEGFKIAYSSYEELLQDEDVDIIYVATPTQLHFEHIKMCLEHGKHVITEKPFALNEKEAKELFNLACSKNVVLFDAIWAMYQPIWEDIDQIIRNDFDEEIKYISASFGYPAMNLMPRLLDPVGGGSLYDLGVYCVAAILRILGADYENITSKFKYYKDVDIENHIYLKYKCTRARIHSSIRHRTSYMLFIIGKKGVICSRKFWQGKGFYYWRFPFGFQRKKYNYKVSGYECELMRLIEMLDADKIECDCYKHKDTLAVMHIMDEARYIAAK